MSRSFVADRQATQDEVLPHAVAIRDLVVTTGLSRARIRDDGTLVVHSNEPGYRAVTRLSARATGLVGQCVHVITDDVSGPTDATEL